MSATMTEPGCDKPSVALTKLSKRLHRLTGRIVPSHLMDRNLHPFTTLQATGATHPGGDRAFDDDADDGHCGPRTASVVQLHPI